MNKYILDVRTKTEYENQHINSAIHHDIMDMMYGKFPELEKDSEIVVYCESGNRSMMACTILSQNGFTNITDAGSIENLHHLYTNQ